MAIFYGSIVTGCNTTFVATISTNIARYIHVLDHATFPNCPEQSKITT